MPCLECMHRHSSPKDHQVPSHLRPAMLSHVCMNTWLHGYALSVYTTSHKHPTLCMYWADRYNNTTGQVVYVTADKATRSPATISNGARGAQGGRRGSGSDTWEVRYDRDGRKYHVNRLTGQVIAEVPY